MCLREGIIEKGMTPVCPVDNQGCFTEPVVDFLGQYVKVRTISYDTGITVVGAQDADDKIMANLKARGRLVHKGKLVHSYPFCWRTDKPLIYKAHASWFIEVERIRHKLVANLAKTHWVRLQRVTVVTYQNMRRINCFVRRLSAQELFESGD